MPRPQRYDADVLLDAAAAILAADGPAAVTMSAVARATGAPSGSIYHRFPTRAALCAQLWLRSHERFHAGLIDALTGAADRQDCCIDAARFTVVWSRARPVEAKLLLVGADALGRADWPPPTVRRYDEMRHELVHALHALHGSDDGDRVAAAVIDVPHGLLLRYLVSGATIPPSAEDIVEDCARVLVPRGPVNQGDPAT
jgi:AcrR family transcriptional regulator